MQAFPRDATSSRRCSLAGKIFLSTATSFLALVVAGVSAWISAGFGIFAVAHTWFTFHMRGNWGDQLLLEPGVLIISSGGEERYRIAAATVTRLRVKADLITFMWQNEGKPGAVMIGGECFSEPTWKAFRDAFKAFEECVPAGNYAALK